MEVCEVCGAFLIVGDAQSRVDDHLMGKQHMGYAKIKSTVEELKVSRSPDTKKQTGIVGLDCSLLELHCNKMNLLFNNESIID